MTSRLVEHNGNFIVTECHGEYLDTLLGKRVIVSGLSHIYLGTLIEVDNRYILLQNPNIILDNGLFDDFKSMGMPELYIRLDSIESFGAC